MFLIRVNYFFNRIILKIRGFGGKLRKKVGYLKNEILSKLNI